MPSGEISIQGKDKLTKGNLFYRKSDIITDSTAVDSELSSTYPDLFYGQDTSAEISGGAYQKYYLSELSIPHKPTFGDASLVGLKHYLYIDDIDKGTSRSVPTLKTYKVDRSVNGKSGIIYPFLDEDLPIFSARMNDEIDWQREDFGNRGYDVEVVSGQVIIKNNDEYPWAYYDDVMDLMVGRERETWFKDHFTVTHPNNGQLIMYFKKADGGGDDKKWAWTTGAFGIPYPWYLKTYLPVPQGGYDVAWGDNNDFSESEIEPLLHWDVITSGNLTREVPISVTTNDSIATGVFTKGNTLYDSEGNVQISTSCTFSNANAITAGQIMKMSCFWDGEHSLYEKGFDPQGSGKTRSQEASFTCAIPYPHRINTPGSDADADIQSTSDRGNFGTGTSGDGLSNHYVDIAMNIETMFPASDHGFRSTSGSGAWDPTIYTDYREINGLNWNRGLVVTFNKHHPMPDETLWDYLRRIDTSGAADVSPLWGYGIIKTNDLDCTDIKANAHTDGRLNLGAGSVLLLPFLGSGYSSGTTGKGLHVGTGTSNEVGFSTSYHNDGHNTIWWATASTHGVADNNADPNTDHYILKNRAIVIPEHTWFKVKHQFNHNSSSMGIVVTDEAGITTTGVTRSQCYPNTAPTIADWPEYMTIWNLNAPGLKNADISPDDKSVGTAALDTEVTVGIDSISYKGWNNIIKNHTVTENNKPHMALSLFGQVYARQTYDKVVQSPTYVSVGYDHTGDFDRAGDLLYNKCSSGYFGGTTDKTRSNAGSAHHWFFQGFNSSNIIPEKIDNDWIQAGFTSNSRQYGSVTTWSLEELGGQASDFFFNSSWRGMTIDGGAATGMRNIDGDITSTSGFSQKGTVKFDLSSQQAIDSNWLQYNGQRAQPEKRENIFASARVMHIFDADKGKIVVDTPSIFNLPEDTEYILFQCGEWPYSDHASYKNAWLKFNTHLGIFKCAKREGSMITLTGTNVTGSDEGHMNNIRATRRSQFPDSNNYLTLLGDEAERYGNYSRQKQLWISPRKFWVVAEIFPRNSDSNVLEDRQYTSLSLVNNTINAPVESDYGPTYSEKLYFDGDYNNSWNLNPSGTTTDLEIEKDYGYGKYDSEDNPGGGFVSKAIINDKNQWQVIDLTPLIEEDKPDSGDKLTTIIEPFQPSINHSVKVATFENTSKIGTSEGTQIGGGRTTRHEDANTKRPFILGVFEDELPVIDSFTIKPNESNPMFPEFEWNIDADDVWYGMIMIDSETPYHQYHKGIHFPLTGARLSSDNPLAIAGSNDNKKYPEISNYFDGLNTSVFYYDKVSEIETFLDPEGLSGWAYNFDGNSDYIWTFSSFGWNYGHIKNMTWRGHIIPSSQSTATEQFIFSNGNLSASDAFEVYMDTNGKINVKCPIKNTTIRTELQSSSVSPKDGKTPMSIIVTLDASLKYGNLKLFINGKLEDQSGKANATGSSNVWKKDTPMKEVDGASGSGITATKTTIGRKAYTGSGYFDGIIEEISSYPLTLYPVVPADGKFVLEKAVSEINSDSKGTSKTNVARLFIYDYHNIRGNTQREVAMSAPVGWRKATPLLNGGSV